MTNKLALHHQLLILFTVSAIFLLLALRQLHLPGYQPDEAFYTIPALNLLDQLGLEERGTFKTTIMGASVLLMDGPYFGSTQTYFMLPFLYLFGKNFVSSRLMPVFFAFLAIGMTWLLCKKLFNDRVALVSSVLLAFNTSYILWSRVGLIGEWPVLVCLSLGALILLSFWYYDNNRLCLYAAFFVLGFGLYTKINFFFIIAGLIAAGALLKERLRGRLHLPDVIASSSFFLLGMFPLIYYNLTNDFKTVKIVMERAAYHGESNLHFIQNAVVRIKQLIAMLGGGAYYTAGQKTPNPVYAVLFLSACLFLGYKLLRNGEGLPRARNIKCVLAMQAVIFLGSCFTLSGFYNHHLLIMFPFPLVTIALFFDALAASNKVMRAVFPAFIAGLLLFDGHVLMKKYSYFETTGERADWSDAVYRVSEYLEKNNIIHPVVLDARAKFNVEVITAGKVRPVFIEDDPPGLSPRMKNHLSVGNYYLFLSPICYGGKEPDPNENCIGVVKKHDGQLSLVRTFTNRAGEPVYALYRIDGFPGPEDRAPDTRRAF